MLKHIVRDVALDKRTQSRYVPSSNLEILQQLNHGSLWVELEDKTKVVLYGATLDAWMGTPTETLFVIKDGKEDELPASTVMTGFYEQRDLPGKFANLWEEAKTTRTAQRVKNG